MDPPSSMENEGDEAFWRMREMKLFELQEFGREEEEEKRDRERGGISRLVDNPDRLAFLIHPFLTKTQNPRSKKEQERPWITYLHSLKLIFSQRIQVVGRLYGRTQIQYS